MRGLLPCPFCGGESLLRDRYINGVANTKHYIRECRHCKATFANWYRSIKKANEAWNRRVDARQLALKTRVCPMCEDCPDGCPVETPKDSRNIVTNADRIRSMNDEELAEFLRNIRDCGDYDELKLIGGVCMDYVSVIEWIQQPAKEEHNETD